MFGKHSGAVRAEPPPGHEGQSPYLATYGVGRGNGVGRGLGVGTGRRRFA